MNWAMRHSGMLPGVRLSDSSPSGLHDHAALKYIRLRLHQVHTSQRKYSQESERSFGLGLDFL